MRRSEEKQRRQDQEAALMAYLRERGQEIQGRAERARASSVTTTAAREVLFLDQLDAVLARRLAGRYAPGKLYQRPKAEVVERVLNVNLSDLHFGAMLDPREVPLRYGHVEEARRLAGVALQVASYKRHYRKVTKLVLNLLGDIIQNQLHDLRDGAPLAEQVAAALHLLVQLVIFLRQHYGEIQINCASGNHGRNTARHHDRATNEKWDSIETMLYYALKKAVAHLPDVTVNIPYTPFFTYKVFGTSIFGTHGDTVLKPGYPNRAINVGDVRKQINEINAKFEDPADKHRVFIVGHVHVASWTKLPNGVMFISNGCLIPTDAYAQSIGITDTACCQTMFESAREGKKVFIVGDRREIDVDESMDRDASLDKVIVPFTSL